MTDGGGQTGAHQVVCAVCTTAYEDEPGAHRIRRCPKCGSRLIRQEDGRLGAVATAAPPPKLPEKVKRTGAPVVGGGVPLLIISGVLLLVFACVLLVWSLESLVDLFDFRRWPGMFVIMRLIVLGAAVWGGIACLGVAVRRGASMAQAVTRACIACRYPLPADHTGRCPECGKLQNPYDPRNGICPGCRRLLRGFHGDACPECGADVRAVTDGEPPDGSQPD